MPYFDYYNRPTNKAFTNLTTTLKPPMNLQSLLGLGLKFIPTPFRTTTFNEISAEGRGSHYLERSLPLHCFFLRVGYPTPDVEFNPKLHVPFIWNPPMETFPDIL